MPLQNDRDRTRRETDNRTGHVANCITILRPEHQKVTHASVKSFHGEQPWHDAPQRECGFGRSAWDETDVR